MIKLLIVGASVLQIPAIENAKKKGLFVGVIDINPDAPGVKLADQFYKVSTNDIEGVLVAARDFKPNGIMTLATDMPMRSVAAVASELGLKGISTEVALKATDKVEMINCFKTNHVPHPWFKVIKSQSEFNEFCNHILPPYIIKPNDSSGSRGVVLINNLAEAQNGFIYSKSASKSGIVLVEEFMQGPEVSVEIITVNGISTVLAITDKLTTGAPYFVEMGHSQPSMLSEEIQSNIRRVAINAVKAIGINNSPSHVEIIVTKNGPKLVELGARMGGDCITTHLVPLSTGVDMVNASIDLSLGIEPCIEKQFSKGSAIRYITSKEGIFQNTIGLDYVSKMEGVKHLEIVKEKGDSVSSIKGSGDRVGYVICQADTSLKAIDICNQAIKQINLEVL
ncbi:MAG: ATP-grasp domain-containing protein [Bacteroidales bacterium]|nr:MAG: ATP-grasp domain-containing protein [Bacteroidales bacterium]